MIKERCAGILLPVTALPSSYGVGTLGDSAKAFVNFLNKAKHRIWQVLPTVPTGYGDSPYASSCAQAGSPYLIDIDELIRNGLLTQSEAEEYSCKCESGRVKYEWLFYRRIPLLKLAFSRFNRNNPDFLAFLKKGEFSDFALFMAIKEAHEWRALATWEKEYRFRDKETLAKFAASNEDEILFWQFTQYEFFRQWNNLRAYANSCGIEIMGDLPLYVSEDSVEVWIHPELFVLGEDGSLTEVAGVPPDYFCEDGQLWGNPVYDWESMKADGYKWWNERLRNALSMYDIIRIDHFRGFDRYYSIPAGRTNARVGRWCDGPKESLFEDKKDWNIVAEDLGLLDDGVYRLMENTGYPGMRILEFAFDGNAYHKYKPFNVDENSVIYTGTHDNDTLEGYLYSMTDSERDVFFKDVESEALRCGVKYTAPKRNPGCVSGISKSREAVLRMAYWSRSRIVIVPLQDLMGTGSETRINSPGTLSEMNWSWSCPAEAINNSLARKAAALVQKSGR